MPALRNQHRGSNEIQQELDIRQTRSPIPTPRTQENRVIASNQRNYRNLPSITVHPSTNNQQDNDRSHLRRSIAEAAPYRPTSLQRGSVENSPTARLIHKLFRNRDPSFLPGPSSSSSATTPVLARRRENENATIVAEAAAEIENVNDTDSEYHSLETLHIDEQIISRSVTPPPAYKSIFIEEEKTNSAVKSN